MLPFLLWFFRIHFVTSVIVGSFTDSFETDTQLWINDSGELRCVDYHCVFYSTHNVKKRQLKNIIWEELELTSDCDGLHCCTQKKPKVCTPYVTGRITSVSSYGHGSVRFLAVPLRDVSGLTKFMDTLDVWACFSLENDDQKSLLSIEISICFRSSDPNTAVLSAHLGLYSKTEYAPLDFDTSKKPQWYRIDYTSCCIRFYVNGKLLRAISLDEANNKIPFEPLHITVGLFPFTKEEPKSYLEKANQRPHIEMYTRLFKITYIPDLNSNLILKDEPLHHDKTPESNTFRFILVSVVSIIIFIIVLFIIYHLWSKWTKFDGRYVLMQDKFNSTILPH